jgi:hypothetical protein
MRMKNVLLHLLLFLRFLLLEKAVLFLTELVEHFHLTRGIEVNQMVARLTAMILPREAAVLDINLSHHLLLLPSSIPLFTTKRAAKAIAISLLVQLTTSPSCMVSEDISPPILSIIATMDPLPAAPVYLRESTPLRKLD